MSFDKSLDLTAGVIFNFKIYLSPEWFGFFFR